MTKKKRILSDHEFLARLKAVGGNNSELARELGISSAAVSKRVRKLRNSVEQGLEISHGRTAVVVAAELMKESPGFRQGVVKASKDLRALNRLEGLLDHIETNIGKVADKLNEPGKKPNLAYIKTLTGLVREGRGLITDSFAIKKDLFNLKAVGDFMEAVIRIMEEYDPDVQRKLYDKLSRLGLEGQVAGADEEEA